MLKEYLKRFRTKKNLSQAKMAELVGTSQSYYSLIETGAKKPGYVTVKKLADTLGTTEEFIRSLL